MEWSEIWVGASSRQQRTPESPLSPLFSVWVSKPMSPHPLLEPQREGGLNTNIQMLWKASDVLTNTNNGIILNWRPYIIKLRMCALDICTTDDIDRQELRFHLMHLLLGRSFFFCSRWSLLRAIEPVQDIQYSPRNVTVQATKLKTYSPGACHWHGPTHEYLGAPSKCNTLSLTTENFRQCVPRQIKVVYLTYIFVNTRCKD